MHVKIGPYPTWVGSYQIAEKILFWMDKYEDDRVHAFGKWLATDKHGNSSYLHRLCNWWHSKQSRKIKIKIDNYDVWNMDHTLALVILPMLQKLKEIKQGSPFVDLEDVPHNLRYDDKSEDYEQMTFPFYNEDCQKMDCDIHTRWDWVLNEMIWTFSQIIADDWQKQYYGKDGSSDYEGWRLHQTRIDNGLRLFGKYYQGLWD